MCVTSNITKSWLELEAYMLEKYKYTNEGEHRTIGSGILTHVNSLITLSEKDPEMFKVASNVFIGTVACAAVIGSASAIAYTKVKVHIKNKNEKEKENNHEN